MCARARALAVMMKSEAVRQFSVDIMLNAKCVIGYTSGTIAFAGVFPIFERTQTY